MYFVIVISIFQWLFRHTLSLCLLTEVENMIFCLFLRKIRFFRREEEKVNSHRWISMARSYFYLNILAPLSFYFFLSVLYQNKIHIIWRKKIVSYRHPRLETRPIFLLHRNAHRRLVQFLDKMHELAPSLAHQNHIHRHDVSWMNKMDWEKWKEKKN